MPSNIITLYHGTIYEFTEIDTKKGKPYKDFGQGFYASQNRGSAINMALRNRDIEVHRLKRRGIEDEITPLLYTIELNESELEALNIKRFSCADKDWVLFITDNRTNHPHKHNYDVVIGPAANDQTNPTIQTYLNEGYGSVGSDRAIAILIELLEPYNFPFQYYFGTKRAAGILSITDRSVINQ